MTRARSEVAVRGNPVYQDGSQGPANIVEHHAYQMLETVRRMVTR